MRPLERWRKYRRGSQAGRIATLLSACAVIAGCSGQPTAPTATGAANPQAILGATATVDQSQLTVQAANLTPDDFAARGWECRSSPVPGRRVCSRPNQGFPAVPPPADRPPSFTLLAWQDGLFDGTIVLLRPDLYCGADVSDPLGTCTRNAPSCDATGEPYIFRPVIGYYECLHKVGP
jgi:hypothetical protein